MRTTVSISSLLHFHSYQHHTQTHTVMKHISQLAVCVCVCKHFGREACCDCYRRISGATERRNISSTSSNMALRGAPAISSYKYVRCLGLCCCCFSPLRSPSLYPALFFFSITLRSLSRHPPRCYGSRELQSIVTELAIGADFHLQQEGHTARMGTIQRRSDLHDCSTSFSATRTEGAGHTVMCQPTVQRAKNWRGPEVHGTFGFACLSCRFTHSIIARPGSCPRGEGRQTWEAGP